MNNNFYFVPQPDSGSVFLCFSTRISIFLLLLLIFSVFCFSVFQTHFWLCCFLLFPYWLFGLLFLCFLYGFWFCVCVLFFNFTNWFLVLLLHCFSVECWFCCFFVFINVYDPPNIFCSVVSLFFQLVSSCCWFVYLHAVASAGFCFPIGF